MRYPLHEKAETCRCYDILIIFYIVKFVLDCKIIYILLITENKTGICHLKINVLFVEIMSDVREVCCEDISRPTAGFCDGCDKLSDLQQCEND